jgi:two-component system LytT family response regulator
VTLRIVIADDELLARQRLRRLLGEIDDVQIVGECVDGVEAVARVEQGGVDVLLLDIQMPRMTGMEVVRAADLEGVAIVFTTAYSEHAVEAFDRDAADYLLKPIDTDRLRRALERARRRLAPEERVDVGLLPRLAIETRKGVVLVDPSAVTHAVIDGVSCIVHTEQDAYVTDFRLSDLEETLPSDRFVRVHRRAIVNLEHVGRLEPVDSGGYLAHLHHGPTVEVSRQIARRLRRIWNL